MLAVKYMRENKSVEALKLLRRSEELSENNEPGLALTYNNLACYYRKINQLRTSLIYLEKALKIEQAYIERKDSFTISAKTASKADTHLNMCAVLS